MALWKIGNNCKVLQLDQDTLSLSKSFWDFLWIPVEGQVSLWTIFNEDLEKFDENLEIFDKNLKRLGDDIEMFGKDLRVSSMVLVKI